MPYIRSRESFTYKKRRGRSLAFFVLFLFFAAVAGSAWSAYSIVRDLPDPERITDRSVIQSTKIYDRTGEVLLYEIHGEERRTVVPLADIPYSVKYATIAAEDIHFYSHPGIDLRGIARAFLINLRQGDITQGGSTITQQLVKNSLLTSDRTYIRKLREVILALLIERKYSKDEILELYLNQIPYGSNAYGIAAAADTYFSKDVTELTLGEAALLAALPKAPTYYSPYGSRRDELFSRRDWIIDRLSEGGYVSERDGAQAKKELTALAPPHRSIRAPHFVIYIREYLNQKYGEEFVERGGLKVVTTLDWELQEEAEKIVREGALRNEELVDAKNAALVAVDPKTGDILTMVGSRDYFDIENDGNVNVTLRPRQPGSAFKPFVYGTAFKKGYTPETVLFDAPTEFNPRCNPDGTPGPLIDDPKECYHPQNYDNKFRGPVTVRQALAQSLNVPSVKLLYLADVYDSIKTATEMGISTLTDPDRYGLSLVLGGAEVTLLEMTSAYGAFSQDGILHPKGAILRVEAADGKILEEKKDQAFPVIDTEIARTLNDILSDNDARIPTFSPTSSLYFPNREVAAKTGTTQDFRDAWTVGYTPAIASGVWVGNNDNTPMNKKALSVMVAAPIWHSFMEFALARRPPEAFTPPHAQIPEKPVFRGMYRAGGAIQIDAISKKRATEHTPPEFIEEVSLGSVVSILYHIKKENPQGPPPSDPGENPQYRNWQAGIDAWLAAHSLPDPIVPQEFDTLHAPENKPIVSFYAWGQGDADPTILSEISRVPVEITHTFPLKEVSLFVDGALYDSRGAPILSNRISFSLARPLETGKHMIKIIAYDSAGNKTEKERRVFVRPL